MSSVVAASESRTEDEGSQRSRRSLLKASALAAVAALVPSRARAQKIRKPPVTPNPIHGDPVLPNEAPVAPIEWATDTTRLLRRITYGVTDSDIAAAKKFGYRGFMERQLDYTPIDDAAVAAFVASTYPLLSQTATELSAVNQGTVTAQLQQATLYRAAFSQRQIYERVVEFWSDHFNISMNKVSYLKVIDDREVIRKYALTTFRELLYASAKSGAMMSYLDQNQSRSGAPNQN